MVNIRQKRQSKIFHLMQPIFLFILDKEKEQEDSINHCESSALQNEIMCISSFHFHYTEQKRKRNSFHHSMILVTYFRVMYTIIELEHSHTSAMTYIHLRKKYSILYLILETYMIACS